MLLYTRKIQNSARVDMQNRRQKVFNRGALQFCGVVFRLSGGAYIIKLTKTALIYSVSHFNLGGRGALFGWTKPTKAPRGDGIINMPKNL